MKKQVFPENKKELFDGVKNLKVKPSRIHGLGVFAKKDFQPKEIIEECPAVLIEYSEEVFFQKDIYDRIFIWDKKEDEGKGAIALGYGSIYNHSDEPQADFYVDKENNLIRFFATKHISSGEEIFVGYGKHWFGLRKKLEEQENIRNNRSINKLFLVLFFLLILSMLFPIKSTTKNETQSKPDTNINTTYTNNAKINQDKAI